VVTGGAVAVALPSLLAIYAQRGTGTGLPAPAVVSAAGQVVWLTSIAAGVVWSVCCAWSTRASLPARRAAGMALACIALVVPVVAVAGVDRPAERASAQLRAFTSLEVDRAGASRFASAGGYRYDLWRIAARQFTGAPLTGVGAGGYAATYFAERRTPDTVRQPHSLPLQALAELGVPGGLGLLAFVGGVLWAALRRRGAPAADHDRLVGVAGLGVFSAWLVHTSADWLHVLPGVTGVALVAAGLLLARDEAGVPRPRPTSRRRAAAGLAVVVVCLLAASTGRQVGADHERRAARASLATEPAAALDHARTGLALSPASLDLHILRAAAEARLGDYDRARTALLAAAASEPHNHVPWALLGDLAVRRGEAATAREAYRRASQLNPRDPALAELPAAVR